LIYDNKINKHFLKRTNEYCINNKMFQATKCTACKFFNTLYVIELQHGTLSLWSCNICHLTPTLENINENEVDKNICTDLQYTIHINTCFCFVSFLLLIFEMELIIPYLISFLALCTLIIKCSVLFYKLK
jgi:hypothetical protein